jgi:hypothetical protein
MQPFDAVATRVVQLAKFYEIMTTRVADVARAYYPTQRATQPNEHALLPQYSCQLAVCLHTVL